MESKPDQTSLIRDRETTNDSNLEAAQGQVAPPGVAAPRLPTETPYISRNPAKLPRHQARDGRIQAVSE